MAILAVSLICAMFGVGGAAAGDHSYARHLRAERRLGALLAHRSPEQLVLAMTPKAKHARKHAQAPAPAVAQAPASPAPAAPAPATPAPAVPASAAASTTATATTPQPATTSTAASATPATITQTATTPAPTTPTPASTGAGATPSGSTANVAAGATGNPATDGTGTTGGTTTTDTTTTDTTTTDTTTTDTTPGNDDGQDNQDATATGAPAAAGAPTPSVCHGRGCTSSQTGIVVPSALPGANSATTSGAFSVTNGSVPTSPAVTPSVIPTPVAATSTQTLSPTAPTSSGTSSQPQQLTTLNLPTLATGLGALRQIHVKSTKRSSAGTVIAAAGTGAVTFAAGPTGSATPTAGTAVAAAPTGGAAATHTGSAAKPKSHKPAPASGSSLPSPISSSVKYITQFVNVIPTAVWMALGAAFALALAFAALALRSSRREREFVAISAAAATDALTGILNRRGFMDAAERELARASRYDRPFVLAYVDVRGLKAVNDTEGHLMGDELIQAVAGLMKESARADDVVGRIGGDEFALLLDEQTAESAAPVVRRIQARVEERRAAMEIRVPWELTIGIAAFPSDGTTLEELLGTADRRLYEQRGIALR